MQHNLFTEFPFTYRMEDCQIIHIPNAVDSFEADVWFSSLLEELTWTQDEIHLFGKTHLIPRLNAWYGDPKLDFSYSGIPLKSKGWTTTLSLIRARLEEMYQVSLNSVLANLYRNGRDKMGWHSDDEAQMCPKSPIVSISLGATRNMQFKSKNTKNTERLNISLGHGDIILMHPPTQERLKHCIPEMRRVTESRINLTFRHCLPS